MYALFKQTKQKRKYRINKERVSFVLIKCFSTKKQIIID